MYNKEYTPIYKPDIRGGETDVTNFDPTFTGEQAVDSVVQGSRLQGQADAFQGFTYEDTSVLAR